MSDLSDLQVKAKKVAASLKSNKDLSPDEKKKLQGMFDKIVDRLDDLQPRKDQLEEMISGLKTLEQEVKKFNTDQNPLKDNGYGLQQLLKGMAANPKTKSIIADLNDIADKASKVKDLKGK
jgi:predicted nuclease with TOPRIM domain